jgi:predicted nuclease of restriction endonuclease-like RecB superfamily
VLAKIAEKLGTTAEAIEAGLYADLRGSEVLRGFSPIPAEETIQRYNLGLAQAVLLRATRVSVHVEGEEPSRYRKLFRAARFHGLLHVVRGSPEAGYTIDLDGPFSLFDAVQRYGLRLALFLPSVLACASFQLQADVLWGKEREKLSFAIDPSHGLTVAEAREPAGVAPDLELFCEAFRRLDSPWSVAANERIFALPGEVVCVPDLVFTSRETGEEVFLEAFGFWSRSAVWQRVELLRKGFPARILLVVGKQLRVSEEVLSDEDAGEIYVYKRTISPREVLERLDRPAQKAAKSSS